MYPSAHTVTMHLKRLLSATFFIAAGAMSVAAWAQLPSSSLSGGAAASGSVVTTDQVRAELLAWAPQGVVPGQPVWVGLQLDHQPDWHTYWKNSGDSGLPTELQWQLPVGIDVGEIAWPTPKKIPIGTLANYGYEKTVLLPVPLTVAPGFSGSQLDVKLKASWLVCRKECIPQEGDFTLRLPVRSSTAASGELFKATFAASPQPLPPGASRVDVSGKAIQVSLAGLPAALRGKTLAFFPETGGVIEPGATWTQGWRDAVWTAQVPLSGQRTESPAVMPVVVALDAGASDGRNSSGESFRIEAKVEGTWPQAAQPAEVSPALQAALQANATGGAAPVVRNGSSPIGLLAALFGALLGGLILNLMPCVFPVLAIKVVGFVHVKDRATRVSTGLAYTAGVVLSFLALGGLLLALRAAGEQLGWGFQLQSPAVVAALAVLFTLLGLNLAGLFEFGSLVPGRVAGLQAKNPAVNAFLSGILATVIASPCTAPFMGASLGYAVSLPPAEALAVFGAIGLGMALPYLAASLVPAIANALPRPGAWMATFKMLMSFPMFATVAWLVWVLGQQSGIDGAGALLGLLVLMSFAIWAFTLKGRARVGLAALSVALLGLALWNIGPSVTRPQDVAAAPGKPGERWQAWTPGKVEQLNAAGQSVLVDFTAAWCVTCQYNKKTTLANGEVLADVDAKNVALLRADWTRRDPAVTAALAALGRNGVPLYVVYKPGRAPVLMSEILSVDEVRAELARL